MCFQLLLAMENQNYCKSCCLHHLFLCVPANLFSPNILFIDITCILPHASSVNLYQHAVGRQVRFTFLIRHHLILSTFEWFVEWKIKNFNVFSIKACLHQFSPIIAVSSNSISFWLRISSLSGHKGDSKNVGSPVRFLIYQIKNVKPMLGSIESTQTEESSQQNTV